MDIDHSSLDYIHTRDKLLFKAFKGIVYEHDVPADIIYWSGDLESFGYTQETMGSDENSWTNKIHPEDAAQARKTFQEAELGTKIFDGKYRFQCGNGDFIWVHDYGFMEVDPKTNQAITVIGVVQNIQKEVDDKKHLESKLAELENINKLMVNRELKMIDLKKELQDLEQKK